MKFISPSWDVFAHDSNSWCNVLISSLPLNFPSPVQLRREGEALLGTWHPSRVTSPHKVWRGWELFPTAAGNCCRECIRDIIKALNILQATQSIHPSIWWKDCKFPETHPATSWISWLGKPGKMNSHFILPFPHKPELFCCFWDMLTGDIAVQWAGRGFQAGAQQNPGCWDPILQLRPRVTAPPGALPPAASRFSVSLGCLKGSKTPPRLCYTTGVISGIGEQPGGCPNGIILSQLKTNMPISS